MSLFQCDNCGTMDNTALSECGHGQMKHLSDNFNLIEEYRIKFGLKPNEPFGLYCSECCPLGEQKWHGKFDRIYLPKGEFEIAPNGNLRRKNTLDEDVRKYAIKIEKK